MVACPRQISCYPDNMASATEPIERLRQRLNILYVLVAFLYVGILVEFYLTVTVLRQGETCLKCSGDLPVAEDTSSENDKHEPSLDRRRALNKIEQKPRRDLNYNSAANERGNSGEYKTSNDRKSGYYVHQNVGVSREPSKIYDGEDIPRREENDVPGLSFGRTAHKRATERLLDDIQIAEQNEKDFEDFISGAGDDSSRDIYGALHHERVGGSSSRDRTTSDFVDADGVRDFSDDDVLHRVKRSYWRRRRTRQYSPPGDNRPSVDFYDKPQNKQDDDEYVWLTSYSRIPMEILEEYCVALKERCPPGDKGSPGIPGSPGLIGEKGERGDRGFPGEIGMRGPQGFHGATGPIGPKGEKGFKGQPGLDGRDGIPGEPGLDGVPGRDGIDGIPGRDGIPGIPGTPGMPGKNGTNGTPGAPGDRGPQGPPGPMGLEGPRGRRGPSGTPGVNGTPGITAWMANLTKNETILTAPSIVDKDQQTTLIVDEGHNVRLRCTAAGNPKPRISWKRIDSKPITYKWLQQSSVPEILDVQGITRDKSGVYRCTADNGIPPQDTLDIKLEVAFPPLIKIRNKNIGTVNGSYAVLECIIDAHPPAVNFWLHENNRMVEPSWKYKMSQKDDGYTTTMALNITHIDHTDYGHYKCVSKNDRGKTQGVFNVFETDPNLPMPLPTDEPTFEVYGQLPPVMKLDDNDCEACMTLCEAPPACPTGGQLHPSKIETVYVPNIIHLRLPEKRQDNCMIHQLGKPVFQRSSKDEQGSWYQDALPTPENEHKYYVTLLSDPYVLYEYNNRENFRKDNYSVKHDVTKEIAGNAHAVYNGTFYFHEARSNIIMKYVIANNSTKGEPIPDLDKRNFLYNTNMSHMDISVDENGLWVIYSSIYSNYTVLRKLNPYTLQTEYMWNITYHHRNVGDMFICCGVLYAVNSITDPNTKITFAFDIYQKKVLDVDIQFSNPFRQNSMISYNPRYKKIFSWDKGNQLTYPILFGTIDMGQPEQRETDGLS